MSTSEILTLGLVVIVPALLLWAIFVVRTGGLGSKRRPRLGIPQALRPGQPDEVLEGPRLERLLTWGLVSSLVAALFIPVYWLPEKQRQEAFQHRFDEEAIHRGSLIFAVAPPLDEDASAAEFKEEEAKISLGQACANCHGGDASGGLANPAYKDPISGKTVAYKAPPLNNVFQRWDEEVVKFTIERGRPGTPMPAWGVEFGGPMTEQMISDVMAWLKSIQLPPPELPEPCNDPFADDELSCASGAEIFEARCVVCHGARGQGREAAGTTDDPVLQGMGLWKGDVKHLDRAQHLFTIRNGRRFAFMPQFAEAPAQGIPIPPYPLTDEQIEAVLEYERTL